MFTVFLPEHRSNQGDEMKTTGHTRVEKSSEGILQYIKDHNLTAGDKLPTEMELSKLLGVGRNTVREALRLLLSRNNYQEILKTYYGE